MEKGFFGVAGVSYTGSTLLCGLFGQCPGVIGLGEVHWLIDKPDYARCKCDLGDACHITADILRPGLSDENLYDRCAQAVGSNTLVISDKSAWLYERFSRPGQVHAVLLYRRPEAVAASVKRHGDQWKWGVPETIHLFVERLLERVKDGLFSGMTVIKYESLVAQPEAVMGRFCKLHGLTPPEGKLVHPPPNWHNIGGNIVSLAPGYYAGGEVRLDERWRSELSEEEIAEARGFQPLNDLYAKLDELAT